MDFTPTYPLQQQVTFAWRPVRAKIAALFCAVTIITPILNDLLRPSINLSILYFLPVLFCAWMGERRLLRRVTSLCVALTYIGFMARVRLYPTTPPNLWHWGLINRSFVVMSLISVTFLLDLVLNHLQIRPSWRAVRSDAEQNLCEEVIFSAQRFAAALATIFVSITIFIVDLVTPQQLNFPILYTVPLLIIVWTRSHLWLWAMTSWLILLAIVGWFLGPPPTISPDLLTVLMTNRLIAVTVLLLLALIIHAATSRRTAIDGVTSLVDVT